MDRYCSSYQRGSLSHSERATIIVEIVRLIIVDLKLYSKELKILRSDAERIFNYSKMNIRLSTNFLSPISTTRIWWSVLFNSMFAVCLRLRSEKNHERQSTCATILLAIWLKLAISKLRFSFRDFVAVRFPDVKVRWNWRFWILLKIHNSLEMCKFPRKKNCTAIFVRAYVYLRSCSWL